MDNPISFLNTSSTNFESQAIEVFKYQAENILIYKEYLERLKVQVSSIHRISDIPFLPISFFKTHRVFHPNKIEEIVFTSSGTTGVNTSKHLLSDTKIYEASFINAFESFFGKVSEYTILALLPSYLERDGSSLIYMCDKLINWSGQSESGFYLHNLDELSELLLDLERKNRKTILFGVSYALLDLVEKHSFQLKNTIVIETGGMKGQRKEMIKEEFYQVLKSGFGLDNIYSEYGMTELLSQAYSKGNGEYITPNWMQISIRDVNDPFCNLELGRSGGINIIDLANIDSCSFIATQDIGRINSNGTFSILGRFDDSDIRGCNLLVN